MKQGSEGKLRTLSDWKDSPTFYTVLVFFQWPTLKISKIFCVSVLEERNSKKTVLFKNNLKKLEYTKAFKDIDELSFSSFETANIEMQENLNGLDSFLCDLDQTLYEVLDFNPPLRAISITFQYNDDPKLS